MERSSVYPWRERQGVVGAMYEQRFGKCSYLPSGHLEGIYTCTPSPFSILQFNLSSFINLTNNQSNQTKQCPNNRTNDKSPPRLRVCHHPPPITLAFGNTFGSSSWWIAIKETYFINGDGNKVEKDDNGQDISGLNANTDCKPTPPLACLHIYPESNIADRYSWPLQLQRWQEGQLNSGYIPGTGSRTSIAMYVFVWYRMWSLI
jgi:hypothetical protein